MTLLGAILKRVQSKDSFVQKKYASPPPEIDETTIKKRIGKKKNKRVFEYSNVRARVDCSPPPMDPQPLLRNIVKYNRNLSAIIRENMEMLTAIKRQHFIRGRVDCHWSVQLKRSIAYYEKRKIFLKKVAAGNLLIYQRIRNAKPRIDTAESLRRDWSHNRRQILEMAAMPFVLFPAVPREDIEDVAFTPPTGIQRPRVRMTVRVEGGACLGELTLELFTDVCPQTCRLFTELLQGDGVGHSYIGTCFFRKVPNLYWSGGDVVYDSGFGCYAQRGRAVPIGAENYHFSHSMPGLLSMRMTRNDEMCGIFNISFKALPQFDLNNVVFGRVVRPCRIYDIIRSFGSALSSYPVVRVEKTRLRDGARWILGKPNVLLANYKLRRERP